MVPYVALVAGPGIGGGLAAAFGNNVPVMIDGILTLFSAIVVSNRLVETPAFIRRKMDNTSVKSVAGPTNAPESVKLPFGIHIVGVFTLLSSIAFSGNLSMYALFYEKTYNASTLYIGFIFQGNAVFMILASVFLIPRLRKRMEPVMLSFAGCFIHNAGSVALGITSLAQSIYFSLTSLFLSGIGSAIQRSQSSSITARFTSVANRGKIFSIIQTYGNFGRIVGPVMATHSATHGLPGVDGFYGLPFIMSGILGLLGGFALMASARYTPSEEALVRKPTVFGDQWQDEEGSQEDVLALGRYVTRLLTDRHYKWVTRRADVEKLLDKLLPELDTGSSEAYHNSVGSLMLSDSPSMIATSKV
eukprot:TRINITY_DN4024_c0_g2_i5.p1 TRINITY_DN4024_c0_g2~~TRINITY_DN4024_c0_g2_i5.p1  ORF type:complete len:391 (+),score=35.25 TRINITY_DN4024_c0_g2_i5:96-1175(+)